MLVETHSMSQKLGVCSDPEYCTHGCFDEIKYNYDNFQGFQKTIKKSVDDLKIIETGSHMILFTLQFFLKYLQS